MLPMCSQSENQRIKRESLTEKSKDQECLEAETKRKKCPRKQVSCFLLLIYEWFVYRKDMCFMLQIFSSVSWLFYYNTVLWHTDVFNFYEVKTVNVSIYLFLLMWFLFLFLPQSLTTTEDFLTLILKQSNELKKLVST